MPRKRLTDTGIEKMSPPRAGRMEIGDSIVRGLGLRVSPAGSKSFSVVYKVPGEGGVNGSGMPLVGRQHRVTLGQWPVVSVAEARQRAMKMLAEVSKGEDPRTRLRRENLVRHANTVAVVIERFIDLEAKPNVKSWRNADSVLRLHVVSRWGDRPIRDIRRAEVHELLDEIVESGRVGAAREVRKHLSRLFNWALDREIVATNPVHGLKRRDLQQNLDAGRALTDDEVRYVWYAAGEMGYPFGDLHRLLLLTGQRRCEWANATWGEINSVERTLEIPAGRFKGGRDHVVPLAHDVWSILEGLPRWNCGDYLFSTTGGRIPVSGFSKAKARLDEKMQARMGEEEEFVPFRGHDLRVTCETRLANLGFPQEIRDAVLGHARPGLQKVYNKHDYLEEKSAALMQYAAHLMEIIRLQPAERASNSQFSQHASNIEKCTFYSHRQL
ncbi:MAG: integrase arm-type DNA-binding domain-containing protein [Alphaproteobacteria bacterium]|nr:integrase arm-type DNA-binding domain-containing protein [Alphaproteobacteria bacterium]